jgi:hypothetical protein
METKPKIIDASRAGNATGTHPRAPRRRRSGPVDVYGQPPTIGAGIGVVAGAGVDPESLLREAAEAMFRIKHAARR